MVKFSVFSVSVSQRLCPQWISEIKIVGDKAVEKLSINLCVSFQKEKYYTEFFAYN